MSANTVTEHSFTVSVTVPSNLKGKFCGANYLQVFVVDNADSQTQPGKCEIQVHVEINEANTS